MLSLPVDTLGIILQRKEDARNIAWTCTAALKIVKLLYTICKVPADMWTWRRTFKICNLHRNWSVDIHPFYLTPSYLPCTTVEGLLTRPITDIINIINIIQQYRTSLGVAFVEGSYRFYNLAEAAELEYFGKFARLLGPVTGTYVGESRDFGPGAAEIGGATIFYSAGDA